MSTITSFEKFALGLKILESLVEDNQTHADITTWEATDDSSNSAYAPLYNSLKSIKYQSPVYSEDPIVLGTAEDNLPIELDLYKNPIGSLLIFDPHIEDINLYIHIFSSLLSQEIYLSQNVILIASQMEPVVSLQDLYDYIDVYHAFSKDTKHILEELAYTIEQRKYGREIDLPCLLFIDDIDSLLRLDDDEMKTWLKYVITQGPKAGIQIIANSAVYPFDPTWENLEESFNCVIYSQHIQEPHSIDHYRTNSFFPTNGSRNQYLVEIDHDWVKFNLEC